MPLTIGVPKEIAAGEKRVATVPEVVEKLIKLGFAVAVEACGYVDQFGCEGIQRGDPLAGYRRAKGVRA